MIHLQRPSKALELRPALGKWERATNSQQKRLERVYLGWSVAARRELSALAARGATEQEITLALERHGSALGKALLKRVQQGTIGASNLALGGEPAPARVASLIQRQMVENEKLVRQALIPGILSNLKAKLPEAIGDKKLLKEAFDTMRNRPAQYAGGYWTMIFETKKEVGLQKEQDTKEPERIKWELDPAAEHCVASPGFYGCVELEGEYESWGDLKTVPGGQVTCRGSCRCHLLVWENGQWRRG